MMDFNSLGTFALCQFKFGIILIRTSWMAAHDNELMCLLPDERECNLSLGSDSPPKENWSGHVIQIILSHGDEITFNCLQTYALFQFDDGVMILRSSWLKHAIDGLVRALPNQREYIASLRDTLISPSHWHSYAVHKVLSHSNNLVYLRNKERKFSENGSLTDTDLESKRKRPSFQSLV